MRLISYRHSLAGSAENWGSPAGDPDELAATLLALSGPTDDPHRTRGTMVHGTKLPTAIWLAAVREFTKRSGRIRIVELQQACGVSYKTAWRMRVVLRDAAAMIEERFSSRK